jgi:CheY-like chemotaxis protein
MTTSVLVHRKVCFLIDDDQDDRTIFLLGLNKFDPTVDLVTACSGVEALEKIRTNDLFQPDYIFLDMNMPYMSGKECLIRMRKIDRLKDTPIILYSTVRYFEELTSHKASGFVTKPNSVEGIRKILADTIK